MEVRNYEVDHGVRDIKNYKFVNECIMPDFVESFLQIDEEATRWDFRSESIRDVFDDSKELVIRRMPFPEAVLLRYDGVVCFQEGI